MVGKEEMNPNLILLAVIVGACVTANVVLTVMRLPVPGILEQVCAATLALFVDADKMIFSRQITTSAEVTLTTQKPEEGKSDG